jgi:hypothetical protein
MENDEDLAQTREAHPTPPRPHPNALSACLHFTWPIYFAMLQKGKLDLSDLEALGVGGAGRGHERGGMMCAVQRSCSVTFRACAAQARRVRREHATRRSRRGETP